MSKNQPSPVPSNNTSFTDGQNVVELMIPGNRAGLIIGKGGETIKQLQVNFDDILLTNIKGARVEVYLYHKNHSYS